MRQKTGAVWRKRLSALLLAALAVTGVAAHAAEGDPLLETADSNVTVKYDVDTTYPWRYDADKSATYGKTVYVAGNSGKAEASVSNIALTVKGKGVLTFDYRVDTPEDGDATYLDEKQFYGLFYGTSGAFTDHDSCLKATNYDEASWLTKYAALDSWGTVSITTNSSEETTVYVAYFREGEAFNNDQNYVAISNVKFVADERTITLGENMTATVNDKAQTLDDNRSFTAAPNATVTVTWTGGEQEGKRFYGWTAGENWLGLDSSCTFTVTESCTVQAVYAADGTYSARRNGVFYTGNDGLSQALAAATSGDTVVMLENQTLSSATTVPAGVNLLLPCYDDDTGYIKGTNDTSLGHNPDGTAYYNSNSQRTTYANEKAVPELYHTLTVSNGATLTVNGSVMVNAVTGVKCGGLEDQNLISGNYAAVKLNGDLQINNGGTFENYGVVTGSGTVTVNSGGKLGDRYVVRNYRGGTYAGTVVQYSYPLIENDCHAIENKVVVHSGASFYGLVKVYEASGNTYNYTRFPQVDNDNGLIRLRDDATFTKVYDSANDRTTITITGGADFSGCSLQITSALNLSTTSFAYPIDGDTGFVLENGDYNITESLKLMPGVTVDVKNGAKLTVNKDKTLVLYDDDTYQDTFTYLGEYLRYPSDRGAAKIILHGGASMVVNGSFGGQVCAADCSADTYATVNFRSAQALSVTTKEAMDPDGKTVKEYTFPAQLAAADGTSDVTTLIYYNTGSAWGTNTGSSSGSGLVGDLNSDKIVDVLDLNILLDHYNTSDAIGDLNNDKIVDVLDLNILLDHYNEKLES